jgi:MFS family permease
LKSRNNARTTLIVSCISFSSLGWVTSVLGPGLPELAVRTGTGLTDLGAVFTALFLGALCAQGVSGPVGDWVWLRPVQLVGMAVLATDMAGVALSHYFLRSGHESAIPNVVYSLRLP